MELELMEALINILPKEVTTKVTHRLSLCAYSITILKVNIASHVGKCQSDVAPDMVYFQGSDVADMFHLNIQQKVDGNI